MMSQRLLRGSDVCDGLEAAYYGRVTSVTSVTTRARTHVRAHERINLFTCDIGDTGDSVVLQRVFHVTNVTAVTMPPRGC